MRWLKTIALSVPLALLAIIPAYAGCTSPTANEGAVEYFTTVHEFKICDGTNWMPFYCPAASLSTNLLLHFKFDDGGGKYASDSSANLTNNTFYILNNFATSPPWYPYGGYIKGALDFNAASDNNDYLDGNSAAGIDDISNTALSVSVWIYPDTLGANNNGQIVGKDSGAASASPTGGWILRLTNGVANGITFQQAYATTNLVRTSAASAITLGAWNHVVVTWDGTSTATNVHIYVNNTEVSYSTSTNGSGAKSSDASNNLIIGNNKASDLTRAFDGKMDDLRVYQKVLSSTEIGQLYSKGCTTIATCSTEAVFEYDSGNTSYKYCDGKNTQKQGCSSGCTSYGACSSAQAIDYDTTNHALMNCSGSAQQIMAPWFGGTPTTSGLIGWWKMDENTGSTTADSSGNGNTGTLTNSPTWTTGQLSNALSFSSGSSQYVDLGNVALWNISTYTTSAWIYMTAVPAANTATPILDRSIDSGIRMYANQSDTTGQIECAHRSTQSANDRVGTGNNYLGSVLNAWHLVTCTYDGTNLRLYIDGSIYNISSTSSNGPCAAGSCNTSMKIGANPFGNYMNGKIDDVRIYNRGLSASEVQNLYYYYH